LLVTAFLDEARGLGATAAQVVVGGNNRAAISLYQRSGFEQIDDFELHPGTRSLLMRRSLLGNPGTAVSGGKGPAG
jgi:ribosomal protein S18 acetylase RimI-like enzyme